MSNSVNFREGKDIIIPRLVLILLGSVAVVLLVALPCAFGNYQAQRGVIQNSMKKSLRKIPQPLVLLSPEAQFKLIDTEGDEIEPCGRIEGTKVPPECGFKRKIKDIRNIDTLTVLQYEGSDCEAVVDGFYKYVYDIHIKRPFKGKKRCHHTGGHAR